MSNPAPPIDQLIAANDERRKTAANRTVQEVAAALRTLGDRASAEHRSVGTLRLTYPQASLAELGAAHKPPLTKDAYAGRLRRLLTAARKARS